MKRSNNNTYKLFSTFATLLTGFTLFFILTACTVQQSISNNESYTSFTVYPFLENVTTDVASWADFDDREKFFDKNLIYFAENLEDNYDTSYVDLGKKTSKDGLNVYNVYFSYNSLKELSEEIKENTNKDTQNQTHLISFKKGENTERFEICLSLDTWEELCTIIPLLKEPNLEVYGPIYNNPPYGEKTEEDYYYMIDFIFGEGSEDIKKSNIHISFRAPGNVLHTNGTIETLKMGSYSADVVNFSVPLIDVLLLHKPIVFYTEWVE